MKSFRKTSLSDFWVTTHDRISDFYASSWQPGESAAPMLVVRLLLAALAVSILAWSMVGACNIYWLVFLTNWGMLLVTLMVLSGLLVSVLAYTGSLPDNAGEDGLPWYVSVYWLLFNMSVSIAFVITALFWTLVYDPSESSLGLDIATHVFNTIIVLVELLLSRTPVKLLHIYQPVGFGIWYAVFTCIYYFSGGTDSDGNPFIYAVVDWSDPGPSGIIVSISVVGHIILYFLEWVVVFVRDCVSTVLVRTIGHNLPT